MLCNTLVLWAWSVINPGVSSGGTSSQGKWSPRFGRAASGGALARQPPRATGVGPQPLRISSSLLWSVFPAFLRSDISSTRNLKSDIIFFSFLKSDIPFFPFSPLFVEIRLLFPHPWSVGNPYFYFWGLSLDSLPIWNRTSLSDFITRRCLISKTGKKKGENRPAQISPTAKGQNLWNSGPTPTARGSSGAKAPPLAARPSSSPSG